MSQYQNQITGSNDEEGKIGMELYVLGSAISIRSSSYMG